MNCSQCRKEIAPFPYILTCPADTISRRFCSLDCLRAWLGPDRPLTRRVEQPEKPAPSPLSIVVDAFEWGRFPGESDEHFQLRQVVLGILYERPVR